MSHGPLISLIGLVEYLDRSEKDPPDDPMWHVLTVEEFILKFLGYKGMNTEMDKTWKDLCQGFAIWEERVGVDYRWHRDERRKRAHPASTRYR